MNRQLKGFYASRRNVILTNEDTEKKKKRKIALKSSRRTFVSITIAAKKIKRLLHKQIARRKAVSNAILEGRIDPSNEKEMSAFRMSVPQVTS